MHVGQDVAKLKSLLRRIQMQEGTLLLRDKNPSLLAVIAELWVIIKESSALGKM